MIDFIEENGGEQMTSVVTSKDVISPGTISGTVTRVDEVDPVDDDSLDLHFHDEVSDGEASDGNYLFYCDSPDIALLKLLEKYDNDSIGFVFEEASVLCHLSIVLREHGIPAVMRTTDEEIRDGEWAELDTTETDVGDRIQYPD